MLYVIKRNGSRERVNYEKIRKRLEHLSTDLSVEVDVICQKTIQGLVQDMTTPEIDSYSAELCATSIIQHPDYGILAGRIEVSNLQKETADTFYDAMTVVKDMLREDYYDFLTRNKDAINAMIDQERDDLYTYFAISTLKKSYLLRHEGRIVESPQYMLMRVASFIHMNGHIRDIKETYQALSMQLYTHATPTLFNAGLKHCQMASCFLLDIEDDSIDGIFNTVGECANISKNAGGIGLSVHKIRGSGQPIKGTGGVSSGLVPMLRVFNNVARYVDQGGNKRPGAFAIYLEPWHCDVFEFLHMRRNHGVEETKARDLFYALWIPDLFMAKVEMDEDWYLMSPEVSTGLDEVYGYQFDNLYEQYVAEGKYVRKVKARDLWKVIMDSQIETGTPFMLYKDACNQKSNQKNLGTIKSSNLCTEIVQYTSRDETAVCNLGSINLKKCITDGQFDPDALARIVRIMVGNLNRVIDLNKYPNEKAMNSNYRNRPIGIGVQGLADFFMSLDIAFDSDEAEDLNHRVFECIYTTAVDESMQLAKVHGSYPSFEGSPASQGQLQPQLWGRPRTDQCDQVMEYGLRNSLLVAPMPTASTSQLFDNYEAFDPITSNFFTRRTLSGEHFVLNKYLVEDLIKLGLWNENIRMQLMKSKGSVQGMTIPDHLKLKYKTVWEISQKRIINMAAGRGPFVDQSQSMNLYLQSPNHNKLSSMHFYGWRAGLKTGMYYLRSKAAVDPIQFTVEEAVCRLDDIDCESCSA